MALFEPAFAAAMKFEGGYNNDPDDSGGETYRGISRVNWPGWNGWPDVDHLKQQKDFPVCLDRNADLQGRIKDFYKRNFWTPVMDEINDQNLVNWLFDKGINMGIRPAYKLMQRALHVDEDGIIGPQTKAAINAANPVELLAGCRAAAKAYYTHIALHNPKKSKFLHGWLARA
ncbi:MAG TPA: N-acetylmuramidase [Desulfuromonadales bacterium]|nr:N-acetylmuramidase [Desulfuromonadales bacterium]